MAKKRPTRLHDILARRLRSERERRSLSQAAFAEIIGISVSYIAALELGQKFPSPALLETIAAALRTEPYRLLTPLDEGNKPDTREIAYTIGTELRRFLEKDINDYVEERYGGDPKRRH